jgi:hypothetical protein
MNKWNKYQGHSSKKIITLHNNSKIQTLAIFPGATSRDIRYSIYQVLNIPKSQKVQIYDEDRNPVVISFGIPDGTELFIETKYSYETKFDGSESDNVYYTYSD